MRIKKHHLILSLAAVLVIFLFGVFMMISVPEANTENEIQQDTNAPATK